MSGYEPPLHWQRDVGGAQADENLRLLAWAQRSRSRRLGLRSTEIAAENAEDAENAEQPEETDEDQPDDKTCIYCRTDGVGGLTVIGQTIADKTSGPSLEVPYYGCARCIRAQANPARGHGCAT